MTKEDIRTDADYEAYILEKEKEFCALIDKWIEDGPTYKQERMFKLANRLLENKYIDAEEFDLLIECAHSVPKAGDGSINLSFSLAPAKADPEYKSYIAKVMAMMSFFGHVE